MTANSTTTTRATTKLSTFRVDGALFGIDVDRVQEVTRAHELTPVPGAAPSVSGLMNLRGQVVTVIDLRKRLGYPPRASEESAVNVVLRSDGGAVSLLVDGVEGFEDVAEEQFAELPATVQGPARTLLCGAYQLSDELLLTLDVSRAVEVESL